MRGARAAPKRKRAPSKKKAAHDSDDEYDEEAEEDEEAGSEDDEDDDEDEYDEGDSDDEPRRRKAKAKAKGAAKGKTKAKGKEKATVKKTGQNKPGPREGDGTWVGPKPPPAAAPRRSVSREIKNPSAQPTRPFVDAAGLDIEDRGVEWIIEHQCDKLLPLLRDALSHGELDLSMATACSGTDAPVVAMRVAKESLRRHGVDFGFEHVMSCEIEPYKQSFIARSAGLACAHVCSYVGSTPTVRVTRRAACSTVLLVAPSASLGRRGGATQHTPTPAHHAVGTAITSVISEDQKLRKGLSPSPPL